MVHQAEARIESGSDVKGAAGLRMSVACHIVVPVEDSPRPVPKNTIKVHSVEVGPARRGPRP